MRGENIFGVKIVNAGTCVVNVDWEAKRSGDVATWRHGGEGGRNALGRLAEKCEEIRYLGRKSLQLGAASGERGRNLKAAATARDASCCGRLMIGHIFLFPMPDRYTAEWSVDLSGMNGISLPSEGLFNHACRFRLAGN